MKSKSNLKYVLLSAIVLIFTIYSNDAYADSIDWLSPVHVSSIPINQGNLASGTPVQIMVHDNLKDTDGISGDVITVHVISTTYPSGVDVQLTETLDTGDFVGANFVFLLDDFQFSVSDTVTVTVEDKTGPGCTDGMISVLDSTSTGPPDGIFVYSDTEVVNLNNGVGLLLTETGVDTCLYQGKLHFTTTGSSDESTGTLLVSPGDILTFFDDATSETLDAQIVPSVPGKGSIKAAVGDTVTVTYGVLSASITLDDDLAGGRGGGGLIRPGLVVDAIGSIGSIGNGGGRAAIPPTLGLDTSQNRIVEDGFSFNGNAVDVQNYYTPYPLITTTVGQNNTIKLKIYENEGTDNIAHVGVSYGLGKGEIFNEGRATIEYDKSFDGKATVSLFDPKHVLGPVDVTTSTVKCKTAGNDQCLEVTFVHMFRAPLDYNMVATNIWDFERNVWQNYFNHGIDIVGTSMNPPEEYSGIYRGHIYHLTSTGKNTSVDDEGNLWSFDKTWNRNYIEPKKSDTNILNPEKILAIESLGYSYDDGKNIFGFNRMDHRYIDVKNQEKIIAQNIIRDICIHCLDVPYDNINGIFAYDFSHYLDRSKNPELQKQILAEQQRALITVQKILDPKHMN